jgi:ubiquinone/menaquinone biosynthesis C-methylase UbiE
MAIKTKREHPFNHILTTVFKVRIIKNLINKEKTIKLLDAGCGSGFMLSQLEDLYQDGYGIDMSPEAIEFGQPFTRAKLQVGNAEKLEFIDKEFDCIISTDAFEHIPDDKAAMEEAHRVLKDNGYIIIYTPSENGLLSKTKWVDLYHQSEKSYLLDQRYYTIESLSDLAKNAGFTIEYVGYHNIFFQEFFTQFLKLVSALMGKQYEHQANIDDFTKSKLFPLYRCVLLPVITLLVRTEEFIFEKIFLGMVPGHRIVMKCRK